MVLFLFTTEYEFIFPLQTYLLWAHSKDCIHRHKIITRCICLYFIFYCLCIAYVLFVFMSLPSYLNLFIYARCVRCRSGLMLILSADLLLWLNAVTEDTIHTEIELEKEDRLDFSNTKSSGADVTDLTGSSRYIMWHSSIEMSGNNKTFFIELFTYIIPNVSEEGSRQTWINFVLKSHQRSAD